MTEQINYYKWAAENLSPSRARAFVKAFRQIEDSRFSEEYYEARRKEDEIRIAFIRSKSEETNAITAAAQEEAQALEEEGKRLLDKAKQIREAGWKKVFQIQGGYADTDEYKAQREKTSALWQKDNDAIKPAIQALAAKYQEAQTKSA